MEEQKSVVSIGHGSRRIPRLRTRQDTLPESEQIRSEGETPCKRDEKEIYPTQDAETRKKRLKTIRIQSKDHLPVWRFQRLIYNCAVDVCLRSPITNRLTACFARNSPGPPISWLAHEDTRIWISCCSRNKSQELRKVNSLSSFLSVSSVGRGPIGLNPVGRGREPGGQDSDISSPVLLHQHAQPTLIPQHQQ